MLTLYFRIIVNVYNIYYIGLFIDMDIGFRRRYLKKIL